MELPVKARRNLDAYLPETEIVVKIPAGTEGRIVQELRAGIVIVQFNVPSLGGLRVNLNDLEMQDVFELIIKQMAGIQNTEITDKASTHKEVDKILIRALRTIADETSSPKVEKLIDEYQKAIRWIYSRKNKDKVAEEKEDEG
jgi:hypothetical protein